MATTLTTTPGSRLGNLRNFDQVGFLAQLVEHFDQYQPALPDFLRLLVLVLFGGEWSEAIGKRGIRMSAAMLARPDGDDWIAAEAASGKGLPKGLR